MMFNDICSLRYVIEKKEKLGTRWLKCCKTPDKQSQFKVTDVDEGSEVQFQVRAENEAGVGDPSEPTEILNIEDPTSKITLRSLVAVCAILGKKMKKFKPELLGHSVPSAFRCSISSSRLDHS